MKSHAHYKEEENPRIIYRPQPINMPSGFNIIFFGKVQSAHGDFVLLLENDQGQRKLYSGQAESDLQPENISLHYDGKHGEREIYAIKGKQFIYQRNRPENSLLNGHSLKMLNFEQKSSG
jgi:hypothetical protein